MWAARVIGDVELMKAYPTSIMPRMAPRLRVYAMNLMIDIMHDHSSLSNTLSTTGSPTSCEHMSSTNAFKSEECEPFEVGDEVVTPFRGGKHEGTVEAVSTTQKEVDKAGADLGVTVKHPPQGRDRYSQSYAWYRCMFICDSEVTLSLTRTARRIRYMHQIGHVTVVCQCTRTRAAVYITIL
jgi:hypothetical protein